MASMFRARRPPEDGGSGGKNLSGRRRSPAAASPYARPQSNLPLSLVPLPSPPPAQAGSPSWLLGLISSAGKMISSVFRSEGSPSYSFASSSDYSSDGDFSSCPGAEEDFDASEELHEVNQEGKKPDFYSDGMRRTKDIIQVSESKLAIEHLLMQETFSREECNRLIKMIQSRVADSSSMRFIHDNTGRKLSNKDTGIEMDSCGLLQSLTHRWDLPKLVPDSPVMEARLEDKRMASDAKHDLVRRPYPLKADMLHQGIQDEVNSPVDLAKSYMQSLQPQQSQSLSSGCILAAQLNGLHQMKDESIHTITSPSPSLKVFKRKYPYRRSQDDCQRLLSMSRDKCQNDVLDLNDGRILVQVPLPITEKDTSIVSPVAEGTVKAVILNRESSIQNVIEATRPEIKIEPISSLGIDEDKLDVIEPRQKTREHDGNIDICHEHLAFSSTSMVLVDSLSDEQKIMVSDSIQFREHSEDKPLHTLSSKDEQKTGIYEGPCEDPNVPAIKISAGESHTGTRMRSIEGMPIEPSPGTTRGSRKSKVRRRRGRGPK